MDSVTVQASLGTNEDHLRKRSRGGCIDCKKSKVKCDEARPTCGTCARRRHVCQGYADVKTKVRWHQSDDSSMRRKRKKSTDNVTDSKTRLNGNSYHAGTKTDGLRLVQDRSTEIVPISHATEAVKVSSTLYGVAEQLPSVVPLRGLCLIPPGLVSPDDERTINIYFNRHPFELQIGPEFVDEMNALTLMILQEYPEAFGNTLSAIGQAYVDTDRTSSSVSFLSKRARALAKLRDIRDPAEELELLASVVLGLTAVELLDTNLARDNSIPILMGYIASVIEQCLRTRQTLSPVAKYFIRALARQDMIISLVAGRRPSIPTSTWLDEDYRKSVDRLMGYTVTLMPLIEELCILAEDVLHGHRGNGMIMDPEGAAADTLLIGSSGDPYSVRASDLCARITTWRPIPSRNLSVERSRMCLVQAYACRSAALLYLYRLFNPPGSSPENDDIALGMASEIITHLRVSPDRLKMSLWPAFLAACELQTEDDRAAATEIFDIIYSSRGTATALQTKIFCQERVWKARDSGADWDWRHFAQQYPHECMPI